MWYKRSENPAANHSLRYVFSISNSLGLHETSLTYCEKGRPYMPTWTISRSCKKHRYLKITMKWKWSLPSSYTIALPLEEERSGHESWPTYTIATSYTLGAQISVVELSSIFNVFTSYTQLFWAHLNLGRNISNTKDLSDHISIHRGQIWKYYTSRSIFDELRGVWKCGQTLSWVFDMSSLPKLNWTKEKTEK